MISANRARLFLWMLVGVIAMGLAYYLGQPLIQVWSDGTRGALEVVDAQIAELEARRDLILDNPDPEAPGLRQALQIGALESVPDGDDRRAQHLRGHR